MVNIFEEFQHMEKNAYEENWIENWTKSAKNVDVYCLIF